MFKKYLLKSDQNTKFSWWQEVLGWYGFIALMLAYFLVSFNLIAGNSLIYQILNLTGAVGLMIIAYAKRVYQSAILNLIWAIIGLVVIIKMFV